MAKKSKRGGTAGSRSKSKSKARTKSRAKTHPGRKVKASKALGKAGVRGKVGAKAKAKPPARRTGRSTLGAEQSITEQLARNKQMVLAFYNKLIGEKDYEGARVYMGPGYKQHAPYAADGHAGVAEWVRKFKEGFPQHHYEVKKVIAEGDLVMLHLHGKSGPNPFGESVIDIFRIEDGKVVEHWDVIQPIPESADNANSMF